MGKAAHYYNGSNWQQFGVTEADITLDTSIIANYFISIKDGQDNIYVWCGKLGSPYGTRANIIKITKAGIKTVGYIPYGSGTLDIRGRPSFILDRSQQKIWLAFTTNYGNTQHNLYTIPVVFNNAEAIQMTLWKSNIGNPNNTISIYQDRYIWVASEAHNVKIFDYDTKVELASKYISPQWQFVSITSIVCDSECNLYCAFNSFTPAGIIKVSYSGGANLLSSVVVDDRDGSELMNQKQVLIDKWGDLIILTNSGTASTLLKYTIAGVLIDTKNLANPSYNLAIDTKGNYYYQTALATFKIDKNTAQGQAFTGVGTKIRDTGNTGYGSNYTGYQPSVYA